MKKIAFATILASIIIGSSCSKSSSNPTTCEKTVAGIAGTYKITKVESSLAGDITSMVFTQPCQLDDKVVLNANKTAAYVDTGTPLVCSPVAGDGVGTWDVVNGTFTLTGAALPVPITGATIDTWDCTKLIISVNVTIAPPPIPASTIKVTMTKL